MPRYLTKSRFKLALDCPTKLFYTKKENLYANTKIEDPFLIALAEGGFQVEELARMYYPEGVAILGDDRNYDKLISRTNELLHHENVTLFEAAFLFEGLFIRVDILNKKGNKIELIEVKAKSVSGLEHTSYMTKNGIKSDWIPYLYDVAFQQYVIQKSFPNWTVKPYLMMANKDAVATVDGLNQMFKVTKNANNRTGILKQENLKLEDLGDPILTKISVQEEVERIQTKNPKFENLTFEKLIEHFRAHYASDTKIVNPIGIQCKNCEFKTADRSLKSGFHECWQEQLNLSEKLIDRPKVYEVSNLRSAAKLMEEGKFFMEELSENDIQPTPAPGVISPKERQWIQIEKVKENNSEPYFELDGLRDELEAWKFPLNFIDFETSAIALPFTKNRRPYESIAFQFSHHIVFADGRVEHVSEYLNALPGVFPNFDFIRALKASLETNQGSIFRYHNHENNIVNAIYKQLQESQEPDKKELMDFIQTISHNTNSNAHSWQGERDMIDLWQVVKNYYYDPHTGGSNSIKDVLPAVLNSSRFLKEKYSKPIETINLTSKNFPNDFVFLKLENEEVINPYKRLPPLFEGWDQDALDNTVTEIEDISNGGAALTAYGKLQFEEVSEEERKAIEAGLLKYCELDTLAMVMIYEYFREITS
ncbi:DUF2779 domain-containing protein [Namhaeicola litoreus]|uniref:DUF2779 domain-containing protein n=1 Tax=Namhaeicola litoreus TaxID=1052145 RepID=A0ABW3Y067_9FLAO